jgi:tetratricopeptide (TPR) repeat protein
MVEQVLSYAELQFGERIPGSDYRERGNPWTQRIFNSEVEVRILHHGIYRRLCNIYYDCSMSDLVRDEKGFPYLERSISLLSPYLNIPNDSARNQNDLLKELFLVEKRMALTTKNRNQYDLAEGHCQRCLQYSKSYGIEGEEKASMIFECLYVYLDLRGIQGNLAGAVAFAEEAYNVTVEAFGCVHPKVQVAAGSLISCLINSGNLVDAERYALQTYGNLRDKKNGLDQESEELAHGSHNLANVMLKQDGDLPRAEELAREALRIRDKVHSSSHGIVGESCLFLARILYNQKKMGDETGNLFKRAIAIFVHNEGPDGVRTAVGNSEYAHFYHLLARERCTGGTRRAHLLKAIFFGEEAIRIFSKIFGPTEANTLGLKSNLAMYQTAFRELD